MDLLLEGILKTESVSQVKQVNPEEFVFDSIFNYATQSTCTSRAVSETSSDTHASSLWALISDILLTIAMAAERKEERARSRQIKGM